MDFPFGAVVFDFDGTIADSEPAHYRAFREILAPLELAFDFNYYHKVLLGLDDYTVFEKSVPMGNAETWRKMVERKAMHFARLQTSISFQPGFEELLGKLRGRCKLGICSAAMRADIVGLFEARNRGDLLEAFEVIISAEDVRNGKPDPEGYQLACERLGVETSQALAIEDTPIGLIAAKGAGLSTVGVTHTVTADKLKPADYRIGHLGDLLNLLGVADS